MKSYLSAIIIATLILVLSPNLKAQNSGDSFIGLGVAYDLIYFAPGLTLQYHKLSGIGGYFQYMDSSILGDEEEPTESATKFGINYTTKEYDGDDGFDMFWSVSGGVSIDNYYELTNSFESERKNAVLPNIGFNTFIRSPDSNTYFFIGASFNLGGQFNLSGTAGMTFSF